MHIQKIIIVLFSVMGLFLSSSLQAKIIHKERSLYRNIAVTQDNGERCLLFTIKRKAKSRQSCVDLDDPKRLVFRYAQVSMTSFAVQANPKDILVVGLGGGTLPLTYNSLLPEANITAIEIDESVSKVARDYFGFKTSDKIKLVEKDARVYVKRAQRKEHKFDLIVLDAFNGDYIPEHLMTKEFLEEVQSLLSDDGVLVANTFSSSKLYDHESATYAAVFGDFYNLKIPRGNRIIIASNKELLSLNKLIENSQKLKLPLKDFDVSLLDNLRYLSDEPDWDQNARVLTDQFAPANLLQGK